MSDSIIVAIIGIIGIIITINANMKLQRVLNTRNTKQENYNNFLEAFARKLAYSNDPNIPYEINEKFCIEFNRLPLYASEEVINFVNDISENSQIFELYNVIRRDLYNNRYEQISLEEFNFKVPNIHEDGINTNYKN